MLLGPGRKDGYVKHEPGKKYEVGDIIVYRLQSGVNIYHVVVSYEDNNYGRVYETQGINNKYPDSDRVYEHQLVGQVVKFSESELAFLIEMAERGRIPYIEGLGMTQEFEKVNKLITEVSNIFGITSNKLSEWFDGKDITDFFFKDHTLNFEVLLEFKEKIADLKPDEMRMKLIDLRDLQINALSQCNSYILEYIKSSSNSRFLNIKEFGLMTFTLLQIIYSKLRGKAFSLFGLAEELEISDNAMAEWIEDGVPLDTLGYLYNLRETEKLAKFL
ncbi:MAG: hypothetical protein P8Y97_23005, partial [Candidatus Lokiarchaeota archaeon]